MSGKLGKSGEMAEEADALKFLLLRMVPRPLPAIF